MPRYMDSGSLPSGGISLSPGQWYPSSQSAPSSQSGLGNNTLRLYPKLWPVCTLASVLIDVATQGQSGSTFQACVYADNNGAPGALLHDFGAISTASTTPTALTGTWKIPFYGVWWFGGVIQNASTASGDPGCDFDRRRHPGPPITEYQPRRRHWPPLRSHRNRQWCPPSDIYSGRSRRYRTTPSSQDRLAGAVA